MKFNKRKILSVGVTCVSLLALNRAAFAACYSSASGEYCLTNKKYDCPIGCYCEMADKPDGALDKYGNKKDEINKSDVIAWCKNGTKCPWKDDKKDQFGRDQCGTSDAAKIFRCPDEFPLSAEESKSASDCYYEVGKTKLYNQNITCKEANYLPINSISCEPCGTSDTYYCPGGIFKPSASKAQGIEECPKGQVVNSTRTGCIDSDVKCDAGQYLPKNESSCKSCSSLDRYSVCDGGTFAIQQSYDQGIRKCDGDMIVDSEHKRCIEDPAKKAPANESVRCDAGQYLPKNASNCKSCKSGRYYVCDGGVFLIKQSYEQGIRKCDGDMIADSGHTQCIADPSKKAPSNEPVSNSGNISVSAGQYLPANSSKPTDCKGTTKYCPGGGKYSVQPYDQGIFDCPLNSHTNATKAACTISFSKSQMQYGPNGNTTPYTRQCWIQTDDLDSYKACVFGVRIKDSK